MHTRSMVASVTFTNSSSSAGVRSPTLFVSAGDAGLPFLAAGACGAALVAIVAASSIAAQVTSHAGLKASEEERGFITDTFA